MKNTMIAFLVVFFSFILVFSPPVPAGEDGHVVYVDHSKDQNQKKIVTQAQYDKQMRLKGEKEKKNLERKQRVEMRISKMKDERISGSYAANIVLVGGTLNDQADFMGDFELLGEVKNNGSGAATNPEVTVKLYNSSNVLIDTRSTYIDGGSVVKSGSYYDNALLPGETGFFEVLSWTTYSDVDHYTYSFSSSGSYSSIANANLSFKYSPTVRSDVLRDVEIIGEVTNTSSNYMTYYSEVYFALYNASGKVIDVVSTFIDGPDAKGKSYTIQPGASESFKQLTWTDYSSYSSYKHAFEFSEIMVSTPSNPTISLNKSSLDYASDSNSQTFAISNSGSGTLNWTVTDNKSWMSASPASGQNSGTVTVTVDRTGLNPGTYTGTITVADSNATNSPQTVSVTLEVSGGSGGTPTIQLNRSNLYFGASDSYVTGPQTISITNSWSGTLNWSASANTSWISLSPSSGTNSSVVTASVSNSGLSHGTYYGTITIQDPNASNSPQTVNVTLTAYKSGTTSEPFGDFATPVHGSTVSSSVPVTGWVVDDIDVVSIKIYNGSNYVGDGVFVEGPRPDVEQAYPTYPKSYQAGWGYMMLTHFLPNGGNGTFTIYAKATDAEGNTVTLGSNTITCDNSNAVKPFGAIDTPTQGGIASGNRFVNWGWVLTPQPNSIPTNGSTIDVYVDGVNLGHPTYNIYRSDITSLFPGYDNSNGAAGYFYLDTTTYENGVHTIQWTAMDSAGNKDGIGSRYFTIQNTGSSSDLAAQSQSFRLNSPQISDIPTEYNSPLRFRRGFDNDINLIHQDDRGISTLKIRQLERIELQLAENEGFISGYLLSGDQLIALPIGSTIRNGSFCWAPGPGFLGEYRLLLVVKGQDGALSKREVVVRIEPRFGVSK